MKDFVDELVNEILTQEIPKIDNIMAYIANKVQGDFVATTYALLDKYYADWRPKYYIRTDEYKKRQGIDVHGRKHNKSGKMVSKTSEQEKKRMNDISLKTAMKSIVNGQPAIGVARGSYKTGYIAGVCFDESYFDGAMKHSIHGRGFDEMDIVSNFLFSADGTLGYGNIAGELSGRPSAATELDNKLQNYSYKIDKFYSDACKKFRREG